MQIRDFLPTEMARRSFEALLGEDGKISHYTYSVGGQKAIIALLPVVLCAIVCCIELPAIVAALLIVVDAYAAVYIWTFIALLGEQWRRQ